MRNVHSALEALLAGAVDYAGLFPPANLPLAESIRNYAGYLEQPERWLLGRFVVPASRLAELGALADSFPTHEPLLIAALGRSGDTRAGFSSGLAADLVDIESFRTAHAAAALVDVYETRLPEQELDYQLRADTLVQETAASLQSAGLAPFFEVPFNARWQPRARRAIAALAALPEPKAAGFKLRTGGVRPEHIPTPQQVAWALLEASRAGVALKCTAGLHHPFRHFDPAVGAMMHGFINVFMAGVLAGQPAADIDLLAALLEEQEPASFHFDSLSITWKGLKAAIDQIQDSRESGVVSFGSCSFLEPLEDLRTNQLLPA